MRAAAALTLALLAGCNPSPAEDYVARVGVAGRAGPSQPIRSPDVAGAVWVASPGNARRLLYGKPGQTPLFALECAPSTAVPLVLYTRYAKADPHAKAVLALIGNGHVARLKIDAVRAGADWRWQGSEPAASASLEALTGARQVEATVPGAGSLILNPSPLPGALIIDCRSQAPPAAPASAPAAAGAALPAPAGTTGTAAPPPPPAR